MIKYQIFSTMPGILSLFSLLIEQISLGNVHITITMNVIVMISQTIEFKTNMPASLSLFSLILNIPAHILSNIHVFLIQ